MKQIFLAGFLLIFLPIVGNAIPYVDFDTSMDIAHLYKYVEKNQPYTNYFLAILRMVYQRAMMIDNNCDSATPLIPHIIHIIWLGPKLPDYWQRCVQSWRLHHPSWTIFLYLDHMNLVADEGNHLTSFEEVENSLKNPLYSWYAVDVNRLKFDNKKIFDSRSNYAERSDILRFEALYRFGGLYVDVDCEALKSFDEFHNRYLWYAGIHPLDTNIVQIGSALIGSSAGHPIIKACCAEIKNNQHYANVVLRTGPILLTKMFLMSALLPRVAVFPASYFFPLSYEQRGQLPVVWQKEESYAVHHWAAAWLKPEGFDTHANAF